MPTVTYNGNGSDGGSVPVDTNTYNPGDTVTVLSSGNLSKTGDTFARWNTSTDGTSSSYGWPAASTFTMGSTNVTLYAQWYTTQGLTNNGQGAGVTTHYKFSYDSALATAGIEPARTNQVIAACESDYELMSGWFGGITLDSVQAVPIPVYVANLWGGANTTNTITLKPGTVAATGAAKDLRYLIVSEVTEIFMNAQNQGWFAPDGSNEQSCGEALSRFLAQQFLVIKGLGVAESGYEISPSWLNSSLPSSNPSSTQLRSSPMTTLNATIDDTVTTIPVKSANAVPFAATFVIQIDNEQMLATAVNTGTNTFTVTRGYNGTTAASHTTPTNVFLNYQSRADYINLTLEYDHGIDAATGCAMLFLYYLQVQLGFSIKQIVAKAPGASNASKCLRGVYQNLTGDSGDPFPYFKNLLDNAFPPDQPATIPGPNPDNPWPLGSLSFAGAKNTWGKDEVNDIIDNSNGVYPDGLYLALDGFNRQVAGSGTPSNPTVAFGGTTTSLDAAGLGILYETSNPYIPQRILYPYNVNFSAAGLGPWPTSGETPAVVASSISILGTTFNATSEFFFLDGADPYFTNVEPDPSNPTNVNAAWLSADLRVFTATPGAPPASQFQYPVPGGPQFKEQGSGFGDYDIQGAYTYIQNLLIHLNANYANPQGTDPFDPAQNVIPGQGGAFSGDSSVTPFTFIGFELYNNYSFAIARVRLRGTPGPSGAADGVKVFFRLWQTQTADTDWDPSYTYLSNDSTGLNPGYPLAPSDDHTIPFFATSSPTFSDPNNAEFGSGGPTGSGFNNQTITIQSGQGDAQWAYFGCFLDVNDLNNVVNGQKVPLSLPGTHHCLVAQIAYAGSPIQNVGGQVATPENSSLLAQRNLQVTTSDNPGPPSTHRVPQTFDVKPSAAPYDGTPATYPDELVIFWGNIPIGSTATIYWPQVNGADVVALASWMYGTHALSVTDAHTIQCKTVKGVTYIPIPYASGASFAGLFTLDLPQTIVTGQEFNIVVRRISNRNAGTALPLAPEVREKEASATRAKAGRFIVGSFQVKIPVSTTAAMLPAEETTLAIMKARLEAMSPANRWYPVLLRYIAFISQRVNGLGGDAATVPASITGYPSGSLAGAKDTVEYTGKVCEVIFDCFGDFVGFALSTCCSDHRFHSRQRAICDVVMRACKERLLLTVIVERGSPQKIKKLIIRC